jgi:hypothetical protein
MQIANNFSCVELISKIEYMLMLTLELRRDEMSDNSQKLKSIFIVNQKIMFFFELMENTLFNKITVLPGKV